MTKRRSGTRALAGREANWRTERQGRRHYGQEMLETQDQMKRLCRFVVLLDADDLTVMTGATWRREVARIRGISSDRCRGFSAQDITVP